jgi:L-lactate dehydrogenase complex protein LldF
MGQVLMPLLLGLDKTQDLYRACTLCGACKSVCPAGIDHPNLMLYYRSLDVSADVSDDHPFNGKKRPWREVLFFKAWSMAVQRFWMWGSGISMTRPFMNVNSHHGVIRQMKGAFGGWFRNRDLPSMAEETFHERWEKTTKTQ